MNEPILELKKALENNKPWQIVRGYEIKDLDEKTNSLRIAEIEQFVKANNDWRPSKDILAQCVQNRTWVVNPWDHLNLYWAVSDPIVFANRWLFSDIIGHTPCPDMTTLVGKDWLSVWWYTCNWFHCKNLEDIERKTREKYPDKENLITLPLVVYNYTEAACLLDVLMRMVTYVFRDHFNPFDYEDEEELEESLQYDEADWVDGDLLVIALTFYKR
jgi:hypothetical protein